MTDSNSCTQKFKLFSVYLYLYMIQISKTACHPSLEINGKITAQVSSQITYKFLEYLASATFFKIQKALVQDMNPSVLQSYFFF